MFAIEAPDANQQPLRIDHMGNALRVDVDFDARIAFDNGASCTGVIKVDVGKQNLANIVKRQADLLQPLF